VDGEVECRYDGIAAGGDGYERGGVRW
jgi:hypothetical protein